jgi:hypothetical protein
MLLNQIFPCIRLFYSYFYIKPFSLSAMTLSVLYHSILPLTSKIVPSWFGVGSIGLQWFLLQGNDEGVENVLPRDDGSEMNVTRARIWFEKMLLNEVRNLLSLLVIV